MPTLTPAQTPSPRSSHHAQHLLISWGSPHCCTPASVQATPPAWSILSAFLPCYPPPPLLMYTALTYTALIKTGLASPPPGSHPSLDWLTSPSPACSSSATLLPFATARESYIQFQEPNHTGWPHPPSLLDRGHLDGRNGAWGLTETKW